MAVHIPASPYDVILMRLINEARSLPVDEMHQLRKVYMERIDSISKKECQKELGRYLRGTLKALYGEENDEQMRVDVSRLAIGGQVDNIELTAKQRTAVASLLINKCQQLCGDMPLTML